MNKFCTCIFTICVILCSYIICNATVLPYVDVVSKQELPKGVHVGKYNFTYGEEQESIVADDGIHSKTVLLDDAKGLGYIYYRNGIYLICDTSADSIPEHKMPAGAMRKNSPVYFFDSEMNLLNKIEFDGYMQYKKYENGNFFLFLQKASGEVAYCKTSDGVNLIEVTKEEFNAESIESKMTLLCNGDLANGNMILHQGAFLPVIYESGNDKIYWDRTTYGMVMRIEEYDENRNIVYQGISYDGVTFYEVPADLSSGGDTIFTDKFLYYLKTINGKRTNPEEYYRISVEALNSGIKIICNGKYLSFARPPVVENDRTLVPMRFLFEQMGDTVTWDEETMTATASNGENTIVFSIDNVNATVNGEAEIMDVPARLINDKTYVPLRFLSENLGYTVLWDDETNTATILTDPTKYTEPTDIRCSINGIMVDSFAIAGNQYIPLYMLPNYGFTVTQNGDNRFLERSNETDFTGVSARNDINQDYFPVSENKNPVYINGKLANTYKVNGGIVIQADELLPFGTAAFNPETRVFEIEIE